MQNNGHDCGVFACQFMAFLNENIGEMFDFGQEGIVDMRLDASVWLSYGRTF